MSTLDDGRSLHTLTVPGSHDTCAYTVDDALVRTQYAPLDAQLMHGVRMLDIRCRHVRDESSRATSPAARESGGVARNANDKVARTIDDLRRIIEENPRFTLEDIWTCYRGTLARFLKWDANAFEQIKALAQNPHHLQHTSTRVV
ncbi:hypothetical protein WK53_04320 [Burkholderia ubonensis]|uniref:Uncharacterized protein n=1 Tax=Burkholderia ubonensis TaxID=101571 RepID=A0AAW3NC74_9BURK|nr:hypothetical protein WK53_04320 [Burkholderia ubonensis]